MKIAVTVAVGALLLIVVGLSAYVFVLTRAGPFDKAFALLSTATADMGRAREEAKEYRREKEALVGERERLSVELLKAAQARKRAEAQQASLQQELAEAQIGLQEARVQAETLRAETPVSEPCEQVLQAQDLVRLRLEEKIDLLKESDAKRRVTLRAVVVERETTRSALEVSESRFQLAEKRVQQLRRRRWRLSPGIAVGYGIGPGGRPNPVAAVGLTLSWGR